MILDALLTARSLIADKPGYAATLDAIDEAIAYLPPVADETPLAMIGCGEYAVEIPTQ